MLLVVGFHTFPEYLKAGYIGVDVFFVISGFLISSIIIKSLESDEFSFINFYANRVRRIFPALLCMLLSIYLFGFFYLSSKSMGLPFINLGKHIVAGSAFVSNFLLWNETSYFDVAADTKPLLHLWSLGIEEQFYIFWPFLLVFLSRKKSLFLPGLILITLGSFALNLHTIRSNPTATFFSPLTRLWELAVGGVLAYVTLFTQKSLPTRFSKVSAWGSILGFALIAVGSFIVKKPLFPGWFALLPVVGALLIIGAGPLVWFNHKILGSKLLVKIGSISYPLYLWHWPLLFACTSLFAGHVEAPLYALFKVVAVAVSFGLSWLTYQYLEKPIRFELKTPQTALKLVASSLIMMSLGFSAYQEIGPHPLVGVEAKELRSINTDVDSLYGDKPCFLWSPHHQISMFEKNGCLDYLPTKKAVFLWGDSHSASLGLGLKEYVKSHDMNFIQISTGWCEPFVDKVTGFCEEIVKMASQKIQAIQPDVLVIDAYWIHAAGVYFTGGADNYPAFVAKYTEELKKLGPKKILVIGQVPIWQAGMPASLFENFVVQKKPIPNRTFVGVDPGTLDWDRRMKEMKYPPGVIYLSTKDLLCNQEGCLTAVGPKLSKDIVFWDYGHLTLSASEFVAEKLIAPHLPPF